ncbi:MAG: hypothetical protein ACOCV4_03310, partial [Myxococcota bacterium]
CTPVGDDACVNTCERCELCLGKDTIPDDCFDSPEDGGTDTDRCDEGVQACGLEGDDECPAGYYCLTGCCVLLQ